MCFGAADRMTTALGGCLPCHGRAGGRAAGNVPDIGFSFFGAVWS